MDKSRVYILYTIVPIILMILILLFFQNVPFIRYFMGDVIVIFSLYGLMRLFLPYPPYKSAILVLLIAVLIELLQYFNFLKLLGLENNQIAIIILGSTFDIKDLLAYALGTLLALLIDSLVLIKLLADDNSIPESDNSQDY